MSKRLIINVTGKVQGVGFRIYALSQGEILNLKGYAQNEKDGSVTIVAEGKKENLAKLFEWAKHGPRMAYVKKITLRWEKYTGEFSSFEIKN